MSSNIKLNRICQHCGNEFVARTTVTKYCGDSCAKAAYKARIRAVKVEASNKETQKIREQPFEHVKSKDILTVKEAAIILGCSSRAVYDMINGRRLKAVNLGERQIRVKRSEIDRIFDQPELAVIPKIPAKEKGQELTVDNCYQLQEVERKYGIANKTLYSLLKRNNVKKLKDGKFVYVPKKTVDKLLNNYLN